MTKNKLVSHIIIKYGNFPSNKYVNDMHIFFILVIILEISCAYRTADVRVVSFNGHMLDTLS
jgi:hypothetical protein